MNSSITALTHILEEENFDNRTFSDGSPYYPCYGIKPLAHNDLYLAGLRR